VKPLKMGVGALVVLAFIAIVVSAWIGYRSLNSTAAAVTAQVSGKWRWIVADPSITETTATVPLHERVGDSGDGQSRLVHDGPPVLRRDFEVVTKAVDSKRESNTFALMDIRLRVAGDRYAVSMGYSLLPNGQKDAEGSRDDESHVAVRVVGPDKSVRHAIVNAAESLYRQHPTRRDCTPKAIGADGTPEYRACFPGSSADDRYVHPHGMTTPEISTLASLQVRQPATQTHSAATAHSDVPSLEASVASSLSGAATAFQSAVSSLAASSGIDALTGQHERDAAAFLKLLRPDADAEFAKNQAAAIKDLQPTLTMLRVVSDDAGPACAAIVEAKLNTPFFIRDETLKYFVKRTGAEQLHRAIAMLRLQKGMTDEEAIAVLSGLYPGLSKEDGANRGLQDLAAVTAELSASYAESAQVMTHYCHRKQ
jgi:hypothetical protein